MPGSTIDSTPWFVAWSAWLQTNPAVPLALLGCLSCVLFAGGWLLWRDHERRAVTLPISLALNCIAAGLMLSGHGFWVWLPLVVSLAVLSVGALSGHRRRLDSQTELLPQEQPMAANMDVRLTLAGRIRPPSRKEARGTGGGLFLLILVVAAAAVRFAGIGLNAPNISEAEAGLKAIAPIDATTARIGWKLTGGTLFHTRTSPIYMPMLRTSVGFIGPNLRGLRMPAFFWSLLCIPLFYRFIKSLWGRRAAITGAVLFTANPWNIALSQDATFLAPSIAVFLLMLVIIESCMSRPSFWNHVFAGLLVPVTSYFYCAIRPFAVLMIPGIVLAGLSNGLSKRRQLALLSGFLAALAIASYPQWFGERQFLAKYFYERKNSPPDVAIWNRTADGKGILDVWSWEAVQSNLAMNLRDSYEKIFQQYLFGLVSTIGLIPGLFFIGRLKRRSLALLLYLAFALAFCPNLIVKAIARRMVLLLPLVIAAAVVAWHGALSAMSEDDDKTNARRWSRILTTILVLALCIFDVSAVFARCCNGVLREQNADTVMKDRLMWLVRAIIPDHKVIILDPGLYRSVLEFMLYEKTQSKPSNEGYKIVQPDEFSALLSDGSEQLLLAYMTYSEKSEFLSSAYRHWPHGSVIEGMRLGISPVITFRIIVPNPRVVVELPTSPLSDPTRLRSLEAAAGADFRKHSSRATPR